jgi:phage shock protein B
MEFWQFMVVPTVLFIVIVAPLWITMHYRSMSRSSRSLSQEDRENCRAHAGNGGQID